MAPEATQSTRTLANLNEANFDKACLTLARSEPMVGGAGWVRRKSLDSVSIEDPEVAGVARPGAWKWKALRDRGGPSGAFAYVGFASFRNELACSMGLAEMARLAFVRAWNLHCWAQSMELQPGEFIHNVENLNDNRFEP